MWNVAMAAIVVVPLAFGGITFWMLTHAQMGASMTTMTAFFVSAIVALVWVFIVIEWNAFSGFKPKTPSERKELHIADDEIGESIWFEIECILTEHPESTERVAHWIAGHNGTLHYKHLWELRRQHTARYYRDGIIETSAPGNEWGMTMDDLVTSGHPIKMPKGPEDVLEGRLMSSVQALQLGRDTPNALESVPVRRL